MPTSRPTPVSSLLTRSVWRGLNVTLLCALGSCALPAFAGAQQTKSIPLLSELPIVGKLFLHQQALPADVPARSLIVNVEAKGATLGVLVDMLMDQAHASYTLESSLASLPTGNVKLRKVPFSIALDTILNMSHGKATYRLENGIYQIIEREAAEAGNAEANAPKTTTQPEKEGGSDPTITPDSGARTKAGDVGERRINLDVTNADLSSVLNQIAKQAKITITIDPNLLSHSQPVTAHLHNISLSEAMDMLLKTFTKSATYRIGNGGLIIVPKAPSDSPDMPVQTDPLTTSATLVSLDAEKIDLYAMLKLLFAQVKVNYTLDPNLRNILVTAHVHNLPFGTVLEMLLKGTGKPLTYHVENGMWSIVPKM
jgi:hypothetical protein